MKFSCILLLLASVIAFSMPLVAQNEAPNGMPNDAQTDVALSAGSGHITGTVTDTNGGIIPRANIVLTGPVVDNPAPVATPSALPSASQTATANQEGYFEFKNIAAGKYSVTISAEGFTNWTSSAVVVTPGQYLILRDTQLRLNEVRTSVEVTYSAEEVATEQVKEAEQQRVFGFIPNFYVVYAKDPEPMTAKLKYQLAVKTAFDPVTIVGALTLAAINQAGDTPNYRQGWIGFGERYGAVAADGVSNIMIGGAILPALLHQDPRYYYQGTGTVKSRTLHALSAPFVCKGDNGKWQPNYSSVGGDLASAALSNVYYPPSNRGTGLIFQNVGISTGERMLATVVQEFVFRKITSRGQKKF